MKQATVIFVCAFAVLFQLYSGAHADQRNSVSSENQRQSGTEGSASSSQDTVVRVDVSGIIDKVNELGISLEKIVAIFNTAFKNRVATAQSAATNENSGIVTEVVKTYEDNYYAATAKADGAGSSKMTAAEFVKLIRETGDQVIADISKLGLTGEESSTAVKTENTFEEGFTDVEETLDQMSQDQ